MRALLQRVSEASVAVDGEIVGQIGPGLCALVGVRVGDDIGAARRLAEKLWHLRIFPDDEANMNVSASQLGSPVLVVSQFTLYADTSRGRRPSFVQAAAGAEAQVLVGALVSELRGLGAQVETGRFGAAMKVQLVNDGPVTVLVET